MAVTNPADSYNAGLDANGMPTLTALSGTAGTADTTGTAEIFAIGGNPTTGALYVQDLGTSTGGTNINIVTGTLTTFPNGTSGGNIIGTTSTQAFTTTSGGVILNIGGVWDGTITFLTTIAGTTVGMNAIIGTTGSIVGSTSVNGQYIFPAGYSQIIGSMTSYTSGTAIVRYYGNTGYQIFSLGNPIPTGANIIGNIGTLALGTITETRPAISTLTNIVGTNVNITLLAANTSRRAAYFFNEGTAVCSVKLGTTATAGSFTVQMVGTSLYELPTPVYSGIVDGIWTVSTGTMHVTEIT